MDENKQVELHLQLVKIGDHSYSYQQQTDGKVIAEIDWSEEQGVMQMTHTYVDDSLRGQGVAKVLLDQAATYAREHELKMKAICSYVVSAFDRSDEYNDVKA